MPRLSVNGTELNYQRQGTGPPLVMVHGSWGDSLNWMMVAPKLAERFDLVTNDRRAHGQCAARSGVRNARRGRPRRSDRGSRYRAGERHGEFVRRFDRSRRGQRLEWFWHVIDAIAQRVPQLARTTIAEAGHVPQMTHPDELAKLLTSYFLD